MRALGFRPVKLIAAVVALAACAVFPCFAQDRVALVIGNSAYKQAPALPNPVNDASAFAAMLQQAGFQVVLRRDVGINDMRRVLREFTDATKDADVALIYFAGHGIEVDGDNYLIPVDALLERDIDVDDETISLERMLRVIEPARSLRLVILDACRDNPFMRSMKRTMASRSVSKGLAKVEPTVTDTLIAFAAKAGSTASDGAGPHSPYTAALLRHLTEPGLDVRIALGRVRDEVMLKTDRKQEPFYYGSLGGAVIALVPDKANDPAAAAAGSSPKPVANEQTNLEITFWNSIKDDKNPRLFEAYLHRYPNGAFADIARITLEGLKKTASLAPPAERSEDAVPITDPITLNEVRQRLYELNFDPGSLDRPFGDAAHDAIRDFEQQNQLPRTGVPTEGLLRRLRAVGGLKPWGAIVYGKDIGKWGMAWGEGTRGAAVSQARVSCGDAKACPAEISFFGTQCAVFAYSGSSWTILARDDMRKAKDAALSECRKRGKSCEIVAQVCADGAERFSQAN